MLVFVFFFCCQKGERAGRVRDRFTLTRRANCRGRGRLAIDSLCVCVCVYMSSTNFEHRGPSECVCVFSRIESIWIDRAGA